MRKQEDSPPDAPKVQVELKTPYTRHTQTLDIQTNRVSPVEKFVWQWLTWLYPPADPIDFALDVASFILVGGLLSSLFLHFSSLLTSAIALVLLWAVVSSLLALCWFIATEIKRGWVLLLYRVILLLTGVYLGGMGNG